MNENERQNLITEGRQLLVAGPALEAILERIEKLAHQELMGKFRDGESLTEPTAKLFVINQIRQMISSKLDLMNGALGAGEEK